MIGTPPNCACPPGQQQIGGRCIRRACNLGWTGVYPNCCPPGTRFVNGRCVRPAPTPPPQQQTCRFGMVGTPPNCACPPGTRLHPRFRRCLRVGSPTPSPSPAPTSPPPQQNCRMERVCVQWGPAPPGVLAGPCVRYETRRVCGNGPVVR
jgi:hypothetical protein